MTTSESWQPTRLEIRSLRQHGIVFGFIGPYEVRRWQNPMITGFVIIPISELIPFASDSINQAVQPQSDEENDRIVENASSDLHLKPCALTIIPMNDKLVGPWR